MREQKTARALVAPLLAMVFFVAGTALAQEKTEHFVAVLRPGPAWVEGKPPREQPHFAEHAAYVSHLAEKKKLLAGGPFKDGRGAILILAVSDEKEARALVDDEPFTKNKVLIPELHPWYAAVPGCIEKE